MPTVQCRGSSARAIQFAELQGDAMEVQCDVQIVARTGLLLRIWLKQGKERILLARILEFLEKARKRLSRQNSTIKVRKCE